MNENKKKEAEILKDALESLRVLSKVNRANIKDPTKLCNRCMNQFVWQTKEGLFLCEECNKEYCDEIKTDVG